MRDLTGKRIVVTGATSGIGKETARGLAARGAEVLIVGRNPDKVARTVAELKADGQVDGLVADLSSLAEIRRLAQAILARWDTIHVLVNNAGAFNTKREVSVDGFELTFATNHLAYFLLTRLLLPALERGAPARIVNVASDAHRRQGIDFDDLNAQRRYAGFEVYGRSKLMNILFTRELARRLDPKKVTVNALHPGVVASGFLDKPGVLGVLGKVAGLFMISPRDGARTSLYLATSPDVEGVTGGYYARERAKTPSVAAQDDQAALRLWDVSEQLTGLSAPTKAA